MSIDRLASKCALAFMLSMLMVASLCLWLWGGEGMMENWQRATCFFVSLFALVAVLWAR